MQHGKIIETHKGEYPVYSASAQKALTYIDSFDYEGSSITWATNGFAGTINIINGRFSIRGSVHISSKSPVEG